MTQFGVRPWLSNPLFSPPPRPVIRIPVPETPPATPVKPWRARTDVEKILDVAAVMFGCTVAEIKGRGRSAYIVNARLYATVRMRKGLGFSTPHIGKILGGRDHTTILNLLNKADGVPVSVRHSGSSVNRSRERAHRLYASSGDCE